MSLLKESFSLVAKKYLNINNTAQVCHSSWEQSFSSFRTATGTHFFWGANPKWRSGFYGSCGTVVIAGSIFPPLLPSGMLHFIKVCFLLKSLWKQKIMAMRLLLPPPSLFSPNFQLTYTGFCVHTFEEVFTVTQKSRASVSDARRDTFVFLRTNKFVYLRNQYCIKS